MSHHVSKAASSSKVANNSSCCRYLVHADLVLSLGRYRATWNDSEFLLHSLIFWFFSTLSSFKYSEAFANVRLLYGLYLLAEFVKKEEVNFG